MPAFQVRQVGREGLPAVTAEEIDSDQRRDVGNGVAIRGDKFAPAQFGVHPLEALYDIGALHLAILGELGKAALKKGAGILEEARRDREQLQFHPSVPLLDECLLAIIPSHQVRSGMQALQVPADRYGLRKAAAVIEFQYR